MPFSAEGFVADGSVSSIKLAATLQSDNYVAGVSGWQIRRDTGNAEFGAGTFRGSIAIGTSPVINISSLGGIGTIGWHDGTYANDPSITSGTGFPTIILLTGTTAASPVPGRLQLQPGATLGRAFFTVGQFSISDQGTGLVNELLGAWPPYIPTLTASTTNPTMGTGNSVLGTYQRIGNRVTGEGRILFGTVGMNPGVGQYSITLPYATVGTIQRTIGYGFFYDSSTSNLWPFTLRSTAASSTSSQGVFPTTYGGVIQNLSATGPVVPAAGDYYEFYFAYEAA